MQKSLGHLMLDLETMGSVSNSVITSIGAVEFDIATGETGRTFYERINIQSCLNFGLKVTGSTIQWWLTQNQTAREETAKDGDDLFTVLNKFNEFIKELDDFTLQVWGNSARFDNGLLEDAYIAIGRNIPWNFRTERDVRTLVALRPDIKKNMPNIGTEHLPIDDCLFQISYCSTIYRDLNP